MFNFEAWITNRRKEIQENHRKWVSQVLSHDDQVKSKAQSVSVRAQRELTNTNFYLEEEKIDTVSAVQASINQINQTCNERLGEIKQQEQREKDQADRIAAIKARRDRIRTNQGRTMNFGRVKIVDNTPQKSTSNQ